MGTALLAVAVGTRDPAVAAGMRATHLLELEFAGGAQPRTGVKLAWAVSGRFPAAATKPSNSANWAPLTVHRQGSSATVTVNHFSLFWLGDIKRLASGFVADVKKFLGVGYPAPSCVGKTATASSTHWHVSSDRNSVWTCVVTTKQDRPQVRLFANTRQVYRVRGQPGRLVPADSGYPALTASARLTVQLDKIMFGAGETLVLTGDPDAYATVDVARGVTKGDGEALADAGLSLVPIAATGVDMLMTMTGTNFGGGQEIYEWATCIHDALPTALGSQSMADLLGAIFGCTGRMASALFGDSRASRELSVLASLLGSLPGLLAGQIQGLIGELSGAGDEHFNVWSDAEDASAPSAPAESTDVSEDDLRNAEVPPYCNDDHQEKLINGKWPSPERLYGTNWSYTDQTPEGTRLGPVFLDMTRTGHQQAFGVYTCVAGAPSWPSVLELIGPGGKMLGFVKLGEIGHQEHATVTSMRASGASVIVNWASYEGAGQSFTHYRSVVTWSNGKLHTANKVTATNAPTIG